MKTLFIVVALSCAMLTNAQTVTNPPPAAPAALVAPESKAPAATNTPPAKVTAKKKAPQLKVIYEAEPTGLKTSGGNTVLAPYALKNRKKVPVYQRWGAWHYATNSDQRIRGISDAKLAQEKKETAKEGVKEGKERAKETLKK